MVPYKEMVEVIQRKYPGFQRVLNEDEENDTSKAWTVPGFEGRFLFYNNLNFSLSRIVYKINLEVQLPKIFFM